MKKYRWRRKAIQTGGWGFMALLFLLLLSGCHSTVDQETQETFSKALMDWESRLNEDQEGMKTQTHLFREAVAEPKDSLGREIPRKLDSLQTQRLKFLKMAFESDLAEGQEAWELARLETDKARVYLDRLVPESISQSKAERKWRGFDKEIMKEFEVIETARQGMDATQWAFKTWQDSLKLNPKPAQP